jgi:hypothetical protein
LGTGFCSIVEVQAERDIVASIVYTAKEGTNLDRG